MNRNICVFEKSGQNWENAQKFISLVNKIGFCLPIQLENPI